MTANRATLPAVHPYVGLDIGWLLETQAERRGGVIFMVWDPAEDEGTTWTYADLLDQARRTAGGLAAKGVRPGDRVLLHMNNRPEFLAAWFGCAWLGAIAVSTNVHAGLGELRYFAQHSGCHVAITEAALLPAVTGCGAAFDWIASADGALESALPFSDICRAAPLDRRAADPAMPISIMYTSGTTSRPKAVVFTHANALWCAQINASHLKLTSADRAYVYLPLFHLNALGYTMLATLWAGGSFVLHPKFSAQRWWPTAERFGCNWAFAAPFVPKNAGAPPPGQAVKYWGYQWGNDGHIDDVLGIPLLGVYGMTETISQPILTDLGKPVGHHAIGRAAPEYPLRLVDDDGRDVPVGGTGRLLVGGVRGVSLFWEYFNDPDATKAAFQDGWFDTGDMVTLLDDGSLRFADRKKDMLKVGGENVAASEVETVILGVPGIREVAVVGAPHDFLDEVPIAYVVADGDQTAAAGAIEAACAAELAKFKRPREIRFLDALPRLTIGKLDRKALREEAKTRSAAQ